MECVYKVNFQTHGFEPTDIPQFMWEKLKEDFMNMYDAYVKSANDLMETFELMWNLLNRLAEEMVRVGMAESIDDAIQAVSEKYRQSGTIKVKNFHDHDSWIEANLNVIVDAINDKAKGFSFLEGFIFRDGDIPVLGARVKGKPEWTMDFTLELDD